MPLLYDLLSGMLAKDPPPGPVRGLPTLEEAIAFALNGPGQPAINWPRDPWLNAFPGNTRTVKSLPSKLDRDAVRDAFAREPRTTAGAVNCFLAAMAWGYGRNGYGPFRTQRVLAEPGAAEALAKARDAVHHKGPLDGYRVLAAQQRIKHLGPAFGTKFLYFESSRALILDRLIAGWYEATAGVDLKATTWQPSLYADYLATMDNWSEKSRLRPAQLEEAIFTLSASTRMGSQWRTQDVG